MTTVQAPPIADYALIGDRRTAALISRDGSIDWWCVPRFDGDSCFGRLIDWRGGGHCWIAPASAARPTRSYLDSSLCLCTRFDSDGASAQVTDALVIAEDADGRDGGSGPLLIRMVEGLEDEVDMRVEIEPRFAFGAVKPWIRCYEGAAFTAVGGEDGLVISGDMDLLQHDRHGLSGSFRIGAGERRYLALQFAAPEVLDSGPGSVPGSRELQSRLDATLGWWRQWSPGVKADWTETSAVHRSVLVLKALQYAPTGAIVAAPTTSLPEGLEAGRTWDYRFSWIRDAAFTADVLVELGFTEDADSFRRFLQRSAAGSADQLQTLYGIRGTRRTREIVLDHLKGYRGGGPVRIGNQASQQIQLDVYGELLELSWLWHRRGHAPSDEYWAFLVDIVNWVSVHWKEPDQGIWEMRGPAKHYVHSKVMCWSALNRGIALATDLERDAPVQDWSRARDEARAVIERDGYDQGRGIFIEAFDSPYLDAALLRLPVVGFVDYDDPRMVRTVDAIREGLDMDGLLRRYNAPDGLPGEEGAFIACSFWLVECLAGQGRLEEARQLFNRALGTANDLGLFSEEFDPVRQRQLGNFPQGLTHLSHVSAALALARAKERHGGAVQRRS